MHALANVWRVGVRKDVENFFCRFKGRSRILKLGMPHRRREISTTYFFKCCILYDILHSFDGLGQHGTNVYWSDLDGPHAPWFTELRDQRCNGSLETDASNETFKEMLLKSCRDRWHHNEALCFYWFSERGHL